MRFFNLTQIQVAVGVLTSITHRVTGIILVLGIPLCIYILDLSLKNRESYALLASQFDRPVFKAIAVLFIWALAHHLLAGICHLLSDVDIGSLLPAARSGVCRASAAGLRQGPQTEGRTL